MSTIWSIPCPPHQDDICYCWVGWATIISKGIKEEQMVRGCILFYWVGQNVRLGFLQDRMENPKQIFGQPYTFSVSQEIWPGSPQVRPAVHVHDSGDMTPGPAPSSCFRKTVRDKGQCPAGRARQLTAHHSIWSSSEDYTELTWINQGNMPNKHISHSPTWELGFPPPS